MNTEFPYKIHVPRHAWLKSNPDAYVLLKWLRNDVRRENYNYNECNSPFGLEINGEERYVYFKNEQDALMCVLRFC